MKRINGFDEWPCLILAVLGAAKCTSNAAIPLTFKIAGIDEVLEIVLLSPETKMLHCLAVFLFCAVVLIWLTIVF